MPHRHMSIKLHCQVVSSFYYMNGNLFCNKGCFGKLVQDTNIFWQVQEDMSHDKIAEIDSQSKFRFAYIF